MKNALLLLLISGLLYSCDKAETQNETNNETTAATTEQNNYVPIDTDEALIATALMAAPADKRAESTVIGFNMAGEFVTFKEGTNEFICITDNPNQEGFNAAAYHKDLEPFMARGRALKAEGKTFQEIFDIRENEAKAGTLDMGKAGSTLHIYYGKNANYDVATGEVDGAKYRYVVYMPFATGESTGLPEAPKVSNHPWLMDAGTHRAHIMISPKE